MAIVVVCCAGLFVACDREPEMPKDLTMQNMYNVAMMYYPYEEDDELTFKNETLGKTWTIVAKNIDNKSFMENKLEELRDYETTGKPVYGWIIRVSASFIEEGGGRSVFETILSADTVRNRILLRWETGLYLDGYNRGDTLSECKGAEAYSYFTDTISLTMRDVKNGKERKELPQNAYLHIVKNKGISDFSLDGETVWKRVK